MARCRTSMGLNSEVELLAHAQIDSQQQRCIITTVTSVSNGMQQRIAAHVITCDGNAREH